MKRSMVSFCLLVAGALLAAGCAMPGEAEFPRLANMTPILHHQNNLPPAEMLQHPGPGVEGPGPGVLGGYDGGMGMGPMGGGGMGMGPMGGGMCAGPAGGPSGVAQASFLAHCRGGCPAGCGAGGAGAGGAGGYGGYGGYGLVGDTSQIAFTSPEGMSITWDVGGVGQFDSEALIAPGRYNFPQGAIYRLKITNIPGRPGVELYPTIEIGPARPRTEAYLAHNAIPFQLTEEDLDQVLSGNFVTKVIYLPDPEYQELALAGVETLVSTRLDPGVDPIVEADRRGSIMAIIRIGNKDLELPGTVNGASRNSNVVHAAYLQQAGYTAGPGCGPAGCPGGACPYGPGDSYGATAGGIPPGFVAGVTAPQYGMPFVGTPIGLPGPPHVPLGIQAGLERHTMTNWTHMNMPGPTHDVSISVKQRPGFTYPKPANHVHIVEEQCAWPWWFHQPLSDKVQCNGPPCEEACGDACNESGECSDGACPQ